MLTSYNGWTASTSAKDFGGLDNRAVAGVRMAPGVRAGDVATLLFYVAEQFHRRVEPLVDGWCWGFSYRENRNAANLSCHSSATAIDLNAPRHPNGKRGTFSSAQVAEIRAILTEVGKVVRWGGDFTGTPDEMHFEIVASPATVAMVAGRMNPKGPATTGPTILPAPPAQEDDMFEGPDRDALTRVERNLQTLIDAKFSGGPSMPYGLSEVELLKRLPASTAHEVWNGVFVNRPDGSGALQRIPVIQELADAKTQAASTAGELAGALAALAAAQAGSGVDLEAVKTAAREGAEEALAGGVRVTVDVPGATAA